MSEAIAVTPPVALELWRLAAKEEFGLRFPVERKDIERLKSLFYSVRKEAPDYDELKDLMLCIGPEAEELWLVRPPKDQAP